MGRFSGLDVFIAVANAGSFTQAGKKLQMTGSALSKKIQNLESDLEVKLFYRTTRSVTLTEAGELYYKRASNAYCILEEAEHELKELQTTLKGSLKVNLPLSFSLRYLSEAISAFSLKYPEIVLDVSFTDKLVDVVAEGYDVVVRIGAAVDSSLRAKKLTSGSIIVCASPAYLEAHGEPKTPEELKHHNMIVYSGRDNANSWTYKNNRGDVGNVSFNTTFKSDNGDMNNQMAIAGKGITIAPTFISADAIKSGQLKWILKSYQSFPNWDIFALYPAERYLTRKARVFIDMLEQVTKDSELGG